MRPSIPPITVPLVDPKDGRMDARWYRYFFQLTLTNQPIDLSEIADPDAPDPNNGLLYVKDNGAGKTQLVIRFPTGAVQIIATEP